MGEEKAVRQLQIRYDEEAFLVLYRRHSPRLCRFLCRLTAGRDEEAADLFQETWLRAAAGFAGFARRLTTAHLAGRHRAQLPSRLVEGRRRAILLPVTVASLTGVHTDDQSIDLQRLLEALPAGPRSAKHSRLVDDDGNIFWTSTEMTFTSPYGRAHRREVVASTMASARRGQSSPK